MPERIASALVTVLFSYAAVGFLFAVFFVTKGVQKLDSVAQKAGVGFRLIIFPGVVAFWPLLLRRWLSGSSEPAVERNPHR